METPAHVDSSPLRQLSLYNDVFKPLEDEWDEYVCRVLVETHECAEWKDSDVDLQHVVESFLHGNRSTELFTECLKIRHFLQYVRGNRTSPPTYRRRLCTHVSAPHALAHRGRADLLQVLMRAFPEDDELKV